MVARDGTWRGGCGMLFCCDVPLSATARFCYAGNGDALVTRGGAQRRGGRAARHRAAANAALRTLLVAAACGCGYRRRDLAAA